MAQGTIGITVSVGGVTINQQISRTADNMQVYEVSLPAGKAGSLTTRTDNNTGVATLAAGHGVQTGDKVDVYWTGGVRYGMDATVDENAVTIDGGAGDDLPVATTAIVVTPQVTINTSIDGDAVEIVSMICQDRAHVDLRDAGDATIEAVSLEAAQPWTWWSDSGPANPLTGNVIVTAKASSGGSVAAATLTILVLQDSTP